MTEVSYLWDGIVTGDATEAPYNKDEFNKYMASPIVGYRHDLPYGDPSYLRVVAGYLEDLVVHGLGGGAEVTLYPGAALIKNYLYINDAPIAFTLDTIATTGYFRYDIIAIRLDEINQTVRSILKKGEETNDATLLEPPTLTTTGGILEIELFRLHIIDSSDTIFPSRIYDKREFIINTYTTDVYGYPANLNLLKNSEFMAFSSSDGTVAPEYWTGSSLTAASKASVMSRGQSISFTTGSIAQRIMFTRSSVTTPNNRTFTLMGVITPASDTSDIFVFLNPLDKTGTTMGIYYKEYMNLVGGEEYFFKFTVTFDDKTAFFDDDLFGGVRVNIRDDADVGCTVGQCILVPGYHPGYFRQFSEFIPFKERVTDAAWSDTAKSTGTTSIDFTVDFGGTYILNGTKAVLCRLRGRDSGSAGAASAYLRAQGYAAPYNSYYGSVEVAGVTNNYYREINCVVPVNQDQSVNQDDTPQMRLEVLATGAGTFDATVEIIGIYI